MDITTDLIAIWAMNKGEFITSEIVRKEFDCSERKAIDCVRYLRRGGRYRTEVKKTKSSYGRQCFAVKVLGFEPPTLDWEPPFATNKPMKWNNR